MYKLKIRRVGKTLGVALPSKVLDKLGVGEHDAIYITGAPDGFRLTPYKEGFSEQIMEAERIMNQDCEILSELVRR